MVGTLRRTKVCCICCHDFLAEAGGDQGLRTKRVVQEFLQASGWRVVERRGDGLAPYVRDQVWGYNKSLGEKVAS